MNIIETSSTNCGYTFPKVKSTVSENDDVSFSIDLSEKSDIDLSDMYVRAGQKSHDEKYAMALACAQKKYLAVPVAGDMKELMESIEAALANGETLESALRKRMDEYAERASEKAGEKVLEVGNLENDLICIDPKTGHVVDSWVKNRVIGLPGLIDFDLSQLKSQADDLATFIRYTYFKEKGDDPEKVDALISELKSKQSGYDDSRFLPIWSSAGDVADENIRYLTQLYGLDELDEDECKKLSNQLIDEFMKVVEERLASESVTDAKEESDMMYSANAAKHRMARVTLNELLKG